MPRREILLPVRDSVSFLLIQLGDKTVKNETYFFDGHLANNDKIIKSNKVDFMTNYDDLLQNATREHCFAIQRL